MDNFENIAIKAINTNFLNQDVYLIANYDVENHSDVEIVCGATYSMIIIYDLIVEACKHYINNDK